MPKPTPTAERAAELTARAALNWGALLATHERWLRTAIFARLGDRQAADEVYQELAVAVVGRPASAEGPANVSAWLYQIALRQTLLFRRRQGRRQRLTLRYADRGGDKSANGEVSDPLGWLLLIERRRAVREALGSLPARDAEILLLKYTEDWSCRDMAAHLGVSETAIEARLHRARQRLREALARSSAIEVFP
jgi:RNA polymerase sigma-70 factor (ECF subfamily)